VGPRWMLHCLKRGMTAEAAERQAKEHHAHQAHQMVLLASSRAFTPEEEHAFAELLLALSGSKESIRRTKDWILAHKTCTVAILLAMRRSVGGWVGGWVGARDLLRTTSLSKHTPYDDVKNLSVIGRQSVRPLEMAALCPVMT
jgi:hypothetical protein